MNDKSNTKYNAENNASKPDEKQKLHLSGEWLGGPNMVITNAKIPVKGLSLVQKC